MFFFIQIKNSFLLAKDDYLKFFFVLNLAITINQCLLILIIIRNIILLLTEICYCKAIRLNFSSIFSTQKHDLFP